MLALALAVTTSLSSRALTPADTSAIVARRLSLDLSIDPSQQSWGGSTRGWLTVRRPIRGFQLRFGGPTVSRIEMNQLSGVVRLQWSTPRHDSLVVFTERGLAPGPAGLDVACVGAILERGPGLSRRAGAVVLEHAAGCVVPAWPPGAPLPAMALDVHVPAGCTVRANLPLVERSRQGGWRTWSFASAGRMDPDSLRIEVRPPRSRNERGGSRTRAAPVRDRVSGRG
jgi:hypothetical protein